MIPFTLGFIGGFAFAILLLIIFAVVKESSMRSREEEAWVENIGCTMQGLQDKEAEAVKREKRSESREDVE